MQIAETVPAMIDDHIAERFGDTNIPVYKRYEFPQETLLWVVEHNMSTTHLRERLYTSDGKAMFAAIEVIDETSFVVRLTQAMSGWVDVEFFI
jgi:hypothetical protein